MSEEKIQDCIFRLDHRKIKLSGYRTSVLYLANPDERFVLRKQLDECLHPEGDICDWLIETDDGNQPAGQIFAELKGHQWREAADQLGKALRQYPPNQNGFTTRCYIVGTGFPGFRATGQKLIDRFQREFNVRLFTVRDGQTVPL